MASSQPRSLSKADQVSPIRAADPFVSGLAQLAADTAREAASAYTRGVGFEDDEQMPATLRHVVVMRAVRIVGNVQQLTGEQRDGVTMNYGTAGQGFTLQEVLALEQYRRTAC
jgi:hypothetical protein